MFRNAGELSGRAVLVRPEVFIVQCGKYYFSGKTCTILPTISKSFSYDRTLFEFLRDSPIEVLCALYNTLNVLVGDYHSVDYSCPIYREFNLVINFRECQQLRLYLSTLMGRRNTKVLRTVKPKEISLKRKRKGSDQALQDLIGLIWCAAANRDFNLVGDFKHKYLPSSRQPVVGRINVFIGSCPQAVSGSCITIADSVVGGYRYIKIGKYYVQWRGTFLDCSKLPSSMYQCPVVMKDWVQDTTYAVTERSTCSVMQRHQFLGRAVVLSVPLRIVDSEVAEVRKMVAAGLNARHYYSHPHVFDRRIDLGHRRYFSMRTGCEAFIWKGKGTSVLQHSLVQVYGCQHSNVVRSYCGRTYVYMDCTMDVFVNTTRFVGKKRYKVYHRSVAKMGANWMELKDDVIGQYLIR